MSENTLIGLSGPWFRRKAQRPLGYARYDNKSSANFKYRYPAVYLSQLDRDKHAGKMCPAKKR